MLERISNQELIHIVESMRDYDEVVWALVKLEQIGNDKFVSIANKIFRKQLGDAYLQATTFDLLYDADFNSVLALLRDTINDLDDNIIASVMNCLSEDS